MAAREKSWLPGRSRLRHAACKRLPPASCWAIPGGRRPEGGGGERTGRSRSGCRGRRGGRELWEGGQAGGSRLKDKTVSQTNGAGELEKRRDLKEEKRRSHSRKSCGRRKRREKATGSQTGSGIASLWFCGSLKVTLCLGVCVLG